MIQAAILFLSGLAVWLTTRRNPPLAGFLIGMAAQPLWIVETAIKGQWGMFLLSLWFFAAYARGAWCCIRLQRSRDRVLDRPLFLDPKPSGRVDRPQFVFFSGHVDYLRDSADRRFLPVRTRDDVE